jgi:hypothetical protein
MPLGVRHGAVDMYFSNLLRHLAVKMADM